MSKYYCENSSDLTDSLAGLWGPEGFPKHILRSAMLDHTLPTVRANDTAQGTPKYTWQWGTWSGGPTHIKSLLGNPSPFLPSTTNVKLSLVLRYWRLKASVLFPQDRLWNELPSWAVPGNPWKGRSLLSALHLAWQSRAHGWTWGTASLPITALPAWGPSLLHTDLHTELGYSSRTASM